MTKNKFPARIIIKQDKAVVSEGGAALLTTHVQVVLLLHLLPCRRQQSSDVRQRFQILHIHDHETRDGLGRM